MDSKNSQDSHWRIGYNRITQLNETYLKVKFGCNSIGTNSLRIMGPPMMYLAHPGSRISMVQNYISLKSEEQSRDASMVTPMILSELVPIELQPNFTLR